jgi:hypothetical protein
LRVLRYDIEHNVRNHKKAEKDLEGYCKRKWSTVLHKMMYKNVGKPTFFYSRTNSGGKVVAKQNVHRRIFGVIMEAIQKLLFKIGKPINI